jgi:DNA primase
MYYCFGCQKGGGPIHFPMQVENLNFVDAVKKLGSECGVDVPEDNSRTDKDEQKRKQMYAANREAARFFYTCLTEPRGEEARKYFTTVLEFEPNDRIAAAELLKLESEM